ncbi:MAG TPA: LPS-assembly protein LptD, partial [Candidatus Avacidaminococcus intestinavium]|nr:LPS-assembly protein LptD [Candidatus Avacidaminococcus intestinavium]
MKSKLTLLIAICLWAVCAGQSGAVEAAETATSIKADTIEYNTKTGMTVATGNVRIEQDGNVITAPQAEYNTKSKSGQATGGVIMTRSDGNSTSDRLILHDEDHLTVLGNAVVVQADKTLRAPQIEYYKTRGYAETVGGWSELTMTDGSSLTATRLTYDEG